MKRILSILLVIVLIFSLTTMVYAESSNNTPSTSTESTESTESREDEESSNSSFLPLYMFIIAMSLIAAGSAKPTHNKDVDTLINEVESGDAIMKSEHKNIQSALNQLVKDNPEITKTNAYKELTKVMDDSEKKINETTTRHEKVCDIYRISNNSNVKETKKAKATKVSGNKAIPYYTKEEYAEIEKKFPSIPKFAHEEKGIFCGFVVVNKNDEFVADFMYEKSEIEDVINLNFTYEDKVSEKFICKTIRELTEYCYATIGGAYFFFNLDNTNEKFVTMSKKYGLKKHKNSNKYFIDMNDEAGITSIIDTL